MIAHGNSGEKNQHMKHKALNHMLQDKKSETRSEERASDEVTNWSV